MGEAILRALGRLHYVAFSAGVAPADATNPHALAILAKRDISADGLIPKGLRTFHGQSFDYVITLSDPARERAPDFPGADVIHWSFVDPERSLDEHTDPQAFEHLFGWLAQRIRLLMIIAERDESEVDPTHALDARA